MNRKMVTSRETCVSGSGRRSIGTTVVAVLLVAAWLPGVAAFAKPAIRFKPEKSAVGPADATAPVIHTGKPIHDFGEAWIGPDLNHTFVIENKGESTLEISRVRPSCGCTVAGKYPSKIEPGEKGEFPFKISSKKLRGKYSKSIKVYSNDPDTPELQLTLKGICKRYVDVVPTNAYFGKITTDDPRENVLKVTNNTEKPFEVSMSKAEDGKFKFELVETIKGKEYELHIKIEPPYSPGSLRGTTNLLTNVDAQKEIRIGATARVPERLEIQPPSIVISPERTKERGYSRPIRFTNYGTNPVKLLSATADDEKISLAVKERTEGKAYTINVDMPAGYVPPEGGRTITLKTDDPDKPTITIPVTTVQARRSPKRASAKPTKRPAELMVGRAAPNITATTIEGKSLTRSDFQGKVTVLDFFAVNCGFCKKQIPRLEKIRQEYEAKGVRFVSVSQTMRKRYSDDDVKNKIKDLGFKGELVIDHENTAGPLFKATSFPTMVVVGKTGKIEAVNIGNVADLENRMKGQLDAMLAGKPIPQVAFSTMPKQQTPPTPRKRPAELMVGKKAPKFDLTTVAGKKLSTETIANTVTVLDFFAVNCGYCGKQIPRLEQVRKEYESKGVRFVAVSQTMRKRFSDDDVKAKIKTLGFGGELVIDSDNTTGPKFKASGFPTMVILDKKGKIGAVNIGNVGDLESRMKGQLDAMLAGKPVPQIAAATPKPRPTTPTKPQKRPAEQMVGTPAPKFDLTSVAGKKVSNDALANTVTVLDFFAVNCGYCGKQIPRLEKIRQQYESKGVRFVAVSQTMRKRFSDDDVKAKIKTLGFGGELVIDSDNTTGPKFKASGFPTMVILDKKGKIGAVNIGNVGDLESRMKGQLDAMLAGKPVPQIAAATRPTAPPTQGEVVGKPAPKFDATSVAGKKISNDALKGTVSVLDFFAVNCGFCKKQIPRVEKIRQEYESKGVRFIAVSQTMRKPFPNDDVKAKLKEFNFKGELVIDSGNTIGPKFGARGFPTMIILGKDGKVAAANIGNLGDLETRMKAQLDALLEDKPVPTKYVGTTVRASRSQKRPAEALVGKAAPQFVTMKTLAGKEISNADFANHPATVLNFVAPNCGYCKRALPNVEKVRKEYESKGVRFVNVAQTMRKKFSTDEVVKIFEDIGSHLELAHDADNVIGKPFKAVSFPTMVVVSRTGKIEAVNIGAKKNLETLLKGQLDKLLAAGS